MTDRHDIGGNNPPEPIDALPALAKDAADLLDEANSITEITTPEQAAAVDDLVVRAKASEHAIDAAMGAEKRPHLDANIAIGERYKPVKARATLAKTAALDKLTPWRNKLLADRRAEEKRLADLAEAVLQEARDNLKSDDLQEQFEAEDGIKEAARLQATANKLGRSAKGTRTVWSFTLDPLAFGKWAWVSRRDDYIAALNGIAETLENGQIVPGVTWETKEVAK